ncbi:hypothetical protein DM793_21755 [Paenarthrobacter nitroguajacolicus]|nr:hypothetical protein [Paenarthrobacter nitroguajacolicus]
MESIDAHTVVMLAVLVVHLIGVMIVAASAAALMTALSSGILAVRTIRSIWSGAGVRIQQRLNRASQLG